MMSHFLDLFVLRGSKIWPRLAVLGQTTAVVYIIITNDDLIISELVQKEKKCSMHLTAQLAHYKIICVSKQLFKEFQSFVFSVYAISNIANDWLYKG